MDGRRGVAGLFANLEDRTSLIYHLRDGTAAGSTPDDLLRDADLLANLVQGGVDLLVDIPDTVHPTGRRHIPLLEDREDVVHVGLIAVLLDQVGSLVGQDHPGFVRILGSLLFDGVAFDPIPLHVADVDTGHPGGIVAEQEQVEPE